MDFLEIGEQALDVIDGMRAFGVARQLHPLPRRMRIHILGRLFLGITLTY
jgi:hypothetical protein